MAHLGTIAEASTRTGTLTSHQQIRVAEQQDEWDGGSITKQYHRLRVEEVPEFLEQLKENETEKLKVDARRVIWCRAKLAASNENKLLFKEVLESFEEWRLEASLRPEVRFKYAASERAEHCKEPHFLTKKEIDEHSKAVKDIPAEDDFKAGFLFFQKYKTGWKKATYHKHGFDKHGFDKHEAFPNQKMSVSEALYGEKHNPFSKTKDDDGMRHLKYIHLPANHMIWVEVSFLIQKSRFRLTFAVQGSHSKVSWGAS